MTVPYPAGFTHRIDAVPDVGRRIVFIDHAGEERGALVERAASHARYDGVGDDRQLATADRKRWQPSAVMVAWRYAD